MLEKLKSFQTLVKINKIKNVQVFLKTSLSSFYTDKDFIKHVKLVFNYNILEISETSIQIIGSYLNYNKLLKLDLDHLPPGIKIESEEKPKVSIDPKMEEIMKSVKPLEEATKPMETKSEEIEAFEIESKSIPEKKPISKPEPVLVHTTEGVLDVATGKITKEERVSKEIKPLPIIKPKIVISQRGEDGFAIHIPNEVKRFHRLIKGGLRSGMFVGPKGCGKSQGAFWLGEMLAKDFYDKFKLPVEKSIPVKVISCSPEMAPSHIFGKYLAKDGATYWRKGLFQEALEVGLDAEGNEVSPGCIIVFDEFTSLPSSISLRLNAFLADTSKRKSFTFENGDTIKAHEDLIIVTTSNTFGRGSGDDGHLYSAQCGITDISTLDRFAAVEVFDYDREAEKMIISECFKEDDLAESFIQFVEKIRLLVKEKSIEENISTRQIKDFVKVYTAFGGDRKALVESLLVVFINKLRGDIATTKVYNDAIVAVFPGGLNVLKECKITL